MAIVSHVWFVLLIPFAAAAESTVCRACHARVVDAYQHASMSRSFARLKDVPVIEDYAAGAFSHKASAREYRLERRGDRVFQRRFQLDDQGRPVRSFELEATHVIGSGQHARTYLHLSQTGEL